MNSTKHALGSLGDDFIAEILANDQGPTANYIRSCVSLGRYYAKAPSGGVLTNLDDLNQGGAKNTTSLPEGIWSEVGDIQRRTNSHISVLLYDPHRSVKELSDDEVARFDTFPIEDDLIYIISGTDLNPDWIEKNVRQCVSFYPIAMLIHGGLDNLGVANGGGYDKDQLVALVLSAFDQDGVIIWERHEIALD